ncbi:very-long-chain-(S)-2-hydroxy-acid oxidase [Aureococcus anophagefferens]|nr:very-long-chain-(S)-2-hydroxy-acid oxidase [Aureococcus anophagefferens]
MTVKLQLTAKLRRDGTVALLKKQFAKAWNKDPSRPPLARDAVAFRKAGDVLDAAAPLATAIADGDVLEALGDDLLDAVHSVDDFQRLAETLLDRPLYEYLASGSGDEATLRDNRAAFGRYAAAALRPTPRRFDGGVLGAVAWLREELDDLDRSIPLVVKGVMTGEDAALAVAHGADGVFVSTHGGRQLDETLGSLDVLPEVVAAVPSGTPVLLDSGVRRGTDVVKALALGATAVGVGKPLFFSLAVGGERGVDKLFDILEEELRVAMALTGCASLDDITADVVCARP